MRLLMRFFLFAFLVSALLFTACRNEPKLPNKPVENVVKVRQAGDPENLNFILSTHSTAIQVFRLLSMPMCSFDPANYNLTPTLLKANPSAREITEGEYKGTVAYDFEILEEAVWDNGTPITGHDVLFTMKSVFNPHYRSIHRGLINFVQGVEIDKDNPKKFTAYGSKYLIAGPVISNFEAMPRYVYDPNGLLDNFTLAELKDPANQEKLAADENLKAFADSFQSPLHLNDPKGISYAGPYKIESWTTGQELVMVKKKNWWGDKLVDKYPMLAAKPEKIIYKFVPDINAAVSLAKNGEIDAMGKIEWSKFVELKDDKFINDNYNLHVQEIIAHRFIVLNNADPKLADKKVRQALDHLFNRKEVFNTVYYGTANPIIGPISPTSPYYNTSLSVRSFDVEKAKALLKEAGWEDTNNNGTVDKMINGKREELELDITFSSSFKDYVTLVIIFSDAAKNAGINIIARPLETQAYFKAVKSKDFNMAILADQWYPIPKDLYGRYHSKGSSNYGSYSNAEADQIIKEIRSTVDADKLTPLYRQVQEILHEDASNIFINAASDRLMVHKKFGDVRISGVKPHFFVNEFAVQQGVPISVNNN